MLADINVKKTWKVSSVFGFIQQFGLEKQVKKDYKIKKIEDIINHISDDESVIMDYLKKDKRTFDITFIDNEDGYWIIREIKKPKENYEKAYFILMEYWDSISEEEQPEVDKALKRCGL